jgi:hypothetical protein
VLNPVVQRDPGSISSFLVMVIQDWMNRLAAWMPDAESVRQAAMLMNVRFEADFPLPTHL